MKAIVLESYGDTSHFKLKDILKPEPKKGEVRIRIKAAGFNPVDCKMRRGIYGKEAPLILGVDGAGIVDAVGESVHHFSIGDEVVIFAFGQSSNGSYAEFLCLPFEFVVKKPKQITFEQAAALPVAALTAYRSMIASNALKKGDTIFIAGAGGGVGSLAVQLANHVQIKTIFTVAGSEESAHFLQQELGIKQDHILIYRHLTVEHMEKRIIAMNGGRLFDATFDFVGQEMKHLCLKLAGYSGHFSTCVPESAFDCPVWIRGTSLPFHRNLSLHFVFIGAESFFGPPKSWMIYSQQLSQIIRWIVSGSIHIPPVKILGDLSVETVQKAHRLLEESKVKGKLVMTLS